MTSQTQSNSTVNEAVANVPTQLFVGGSWVDATGGGTFEVLDPATGRPLCPVADATPDDGVRAFDAAVAAQHVCAASSPRQRADILESAFNLLAPARL